MAKLGPRGLALVLDILDAQALGSSGIHIVVSDRAEALAAELRARSAVPVVPIVGPSGDTLADALREHSGAPTLALELVAAGQASALGVLHLLNDQRESLVRRGLCCVVIVAGADARAADAAYLELQAHAPDFWSLRSHVHRLVGEDPEDDARARMLELLAPHGSMAAAARWLAGREPLREWVEHRLWREGPRRDAWVAAARPELEVPPPESGVAPQHAFLHPSVILELTALGDEVPIERWPRPAWPSGQLDARGQLLVSALQHALEREGWAELTILPEDEDLRDLVETVLTLGLLRDAMHPLVLHIDASAGLSAGLARVLSEAGVESLPDSLVDRARRLRGALGRDDALVLVTEVDASEFMWLRVAAPQLAVVGLVWPALHSTFGVVAAAERWAAGRRIQSELHAWVGGAVYYEVRGDSAVLELRTALGYARRVVTLVESGWGTGVERAIGASSSRVVVARFDWVDEQIQDLVERVATSVGALRIFEPEHVSGAREVVMSGIAHIRKNLTTNESIAVLAAMLAFAGFQKGEQGHTGEAFRYVQESAALYRELVRGKPNGFVHDLAMTLHGLAVQQRDVGLRVDSLHVMEEDVGLWRGLIGINSDLFANEMASALDSLGISATWSDEHEKGIEASREAVDMWRARVAHSTEHMPQLANALNILGVALSTMGKNYEALRVSQEAVGRLRDVVPTHPERLPDLAMALNNLGIRLGECGRVDEALRALQETIELWKSLVVTHPEIAPNSAKALGVYGHFLEATQPERAVEFYAEGIRLIMPSFTAHSAARVETTFELVRALDHLCTTLARPFPPDLAALPQIAEILARLRAAASPSPT